MTGIDRSWEDKSNVDAESVKDVGRLVEQRDDARRMLTHQAHYVAQLVAEIKTLQLEQSATQHERDRLLAEKAKIQADFKEQFGLDVSRINDLLSRVIRRGVLLRRVQRCVKLPIVEANEIRVELVRHDLDF